jgi:hypothetical protein
MSAEKAVTVTAEMTVAHYVANMPPGLRHADDDLANGNGLRLRDSFASAGGLRQRRHGREIRHLAATPIGRTVRATARVLAIDRRSVVFELEAWDGARKIGDGTHRRGIVNVREFEQRFGVKQLANESGLI